jgi:hypothetical protein
MAFPYQFNLFVRGTRRRATCLRSAPAVSSYSIKEISSGFYHRMILPPRDHLAAKKPPGRKTRLDGSEFAIPLPENSFHPSRKMKGRLQSFHRICKEKQKKTQIF